MTLIRKISFQDSPALDAFFRLRISEPQTLFDSKQLNDSQPMFWDDQQVSGAGTSSTFNTNQASTSLAVSNLTVGKRVRQTFRRFNYQPGKSQLFIFTVKFGAAATGIKRKVGLFDDKNGIFLDQNSTGMGVTIRTFTSGVATDNRISQANWNLDKMDGTGPSTITLDFSKTQIGFSDYEWLGVGRVRFGFYVGGEPIYVHEFLHANVEALVYMSVPNLPLRYKIENDGTGGVADLVHICSTVISEGGAQDTGFPFAVTRGATSLTTNNNSSIYPLIAIRLKSGYLTSTIKNIQYSVMCTSTAAYNVYLLLNPTVVGTALSFSSVANSSIEAATATVNTTTLTGGTVIDVNSAQNQNEGNVSGSSPSDFVLGSNIAGTSDVLVLAVQRCTGTAETFFGSLKYKDQQ